MTKEPDSAPEPLDGSGGRDILHRAARAEERAGAAGLPAERSVDALAEAAAEAGMDPAWVRRAAAVQPLRTGGQLQKLLGGALSHALRVRLPAGSGAEDLERALTQRGFRPIRARTGVRGARVWRRGGALRRVEVVWRPDGGGLAELSVHQGGLFLLWWLAALTGWAGLGSVLSAAPPAWAVMGGLLVLPVLSVRPFWTRAHRRAALEAEAEAMELLALLEGLAGASPQPPDARR